MINYVSLFAVALLLFFFGSWLLPITDPTESVYALTAKEMLAAGDWFSPRIYGDFWFDKPIMFYWELLIAYKIFGVNEFASRFFPAVFATLGLFLTYFFGAKLYDKKSGFAAAIILATSLEYWYISHAVITDMTLLVMFSLTLVSFYLGYRAKNPRLYLIAFAASGVAGRLAAFERTFPREKSFSVRGDCGDLVFADDDNSRHGVCRKFLGRA